MLVGLGVLAEGGRIGVPLGATGHLAEVGLVDGVGASVLETIGRVGVGLVAALDGTNVGTLARVRARVDLEVLGAAEALVALEATVGLFVRVRPHVDQHFVPGTRILFIFFIFI